MIYIIVVIILGIVLGYALFIFYKKTYIKYHGPNSSIVKNTVHIDRENKKCYMFDPKVFICPIDFN